MKKMLSVIMAIAMVASLATAFAVNTSAAVPTGSFNTPKTDKAPVLDGKVDGCYNKIFDFTGKDGVKEDGTYTDHLPVGFNSDTRRYDVLDHPERKDSDWYNCNAKGYAAWDDTYLYLLVVITNGGTLDENPGAVWSGDGIQVSAYTNATVEYIFATANNTLQVQNTVKDGMSTIQKSKYAYNSKRVPAGGVYKLGAGSYAYELALDWNALGVDPKKDTSFGFNVSVNLNDDNMITDAFCGFQITEGIFNSVPSETKPDMVNALKMKLTGGSTPTPNPNPDKPVTPDTPNNPNNPDKPVTPDNPDNPDNPDDPNKDKTEVLIAAEAKLEEFRTVVSGLEGSTEYTSESIDALKAAFSAFEAVLTSENPTDDAIIEAQFAYEDAYEALEKVPGTEEDPGKEPEKNPDKEPEKGEDEAKGGSLLWLWIVLAVIVVLAAAAVCVYFFVLKKDLSKLKTLFKKK